MNPSSRRLFIIATEMSGDLLGAELIQELLRIDPSLHISAMAGPKMRQLPIETLFLMEDLQVMGFTAVLQKLFSIIRLFFRLRQILLSGHYDAIITIDSPDFHLPLARSLRKKGYRGQIIQYVCPSVWAWRKGRIWQLERDFDQLLTLFPFEPEYFKNTSLPTQYVGHPLAEQTPWVSTRTPSSILALFPGSRGKEIEKNFPMQLAVAEKLRKKDPSLQIHVSISHLKYQSLLEKIAHAHQVQWVFPEQRLSLMQECHLAIAKSGTITLELALCGTPTVVCYVMSRFEVLLAKYLLRIHLPFYCIVNLLAQREVFPEFFGPLCTLDALEKAASDLWHHLERRNACQNLCLDIRHILDPRPSVKPARNAAEKILSFWPQRNLEKEF